MASDPWGAEAEEKGFEHERRGRTAEELAREAQECIDDTSLRGDLLRLYLAAWLSECVVRGDLDAIERAHPLAARRYTRTIDGT